MALEKNQSENILLSYQTAIVLIIYPKINENVFSGEGLAACASDIVIIDSNSKVQNIKKLKYSAEIPKMVRGSRKLCEMLGMFHSSTLASLYYQLSIKYIDQINVSLSISQFFLGTQQWP